MTMVFLVAFAWGASAQSQPPLSVLECDSCSEEQRAQRAINAGLGFHYVVDFGQQPAIRYYRVENMLAGSGGSENQSRSTATPGRQFMLGAFELVVPETARAAFDQFNALYQEAKSARYDTIEIGPRDFYSTPIQILSPLARDRLTADVRQYLVYGLPDTSPARTRFMMTQGGVTFEFTVDARIASITVVGQPSNITVRVRVRDLAGGHVDIEYSRANPDGRIVDVRNSEGEFIDLDLLAQRLADQLEVIIDPGNTPGASYYYREDLRRRGIVVGTGGSIPTKYCCGMSCVGGVCRYECVPCTQPN